MHPLTRYTLLLAIWPLAYGLTACGDAQSPRLAGSAGQLAETQLASEMLQKMATYKHLMLDDDHIQKQAEQGRFLRVEHPDADGWVDMLTLADANQKPIVVYLQSICEPDCEQQLRLYSHHEGRFVESSKQLLPPNLGSQLLKGRQNRNEDRISLGYQIDPKTGNIAIYTYRVNDQKVYETMEMYGTPIAQLLWTDRGYTLSAEAATANEDAQ